MKSENVRSSEAANHAAGSRSHGDEHFDEGVGLRARLNGA